MEETIIALLNNNLRVIIPDFGAFIIRQKQPRIIVFNEFLRYNDGILIDFIVKTEGIDRDIAEQRVADFAEDGTKLLSSGRELVIEGLGSLKKDSSGKISFIEAPEIIEIENKNVPEPEIPEKPVMQQPIEQQIPEKPISKTADRPKSKVKKAPVKVKPARTTKPLPKSLPPDVPLKAVESAFVEPQAAIEAAPVEKPEAIEAAPVEMEAAIEATPVEKQEAIEAAPVEMEEAIEATPVEKQEAIEAAPVEPEAVMEVPTVLTQEAVDAAVAEFRSEPERAPFEIPSAIKPVSQPAGIPPRASEPDGTFNKPSTNSTNRILAWVLIILFVNAGILAWFVFRNKTKGTTTRKPAITTISDTLYDRLADSVRAAAMDSSIVYTEVPGEKSNLQGNVLAPGSRYYIVAGCFRDEINADSLVSSLKLLGYKAEKFGKIGNLFAVCFASFDDKDKAVSELKKIREKVPSAWMTKF